MGVTASYIRLWRIFILLDPAELRGFRSPQRHKEHKEKSPYFPLCQRGIKGDLIRATRLNDTVGQVRPIRDIRVLFSVYAVTAMTTGLPNGPNRLRRSNHCALYAIVTVASFPTLWT